LTYTGLAGYDLCKNWGSGTHVLLDMKNMEICGYLWTSRENLLEDGANTREQI
jgi:hypothetical protein